MLVMYIQKKRIEYYDSFGSSGRRYLEGALRYLGDEANKLGKADFNSGEWVLNSPGKAIPQQENCHDCGVFSTMCADFISDNLPLQYSQEQMPHIRHKICANILRGSLKYPQLVNS